MCGFDLFLSKFFVPLSLGGRSSSGSLQDSAVYQMEVSREHKSDALLKAKQPVGAAWCVSRGKAPLQVSLRTLQLLRMLHLCAVS